MLGKQTVCVGNEMTGQETCNTAIEKDVFYSATLLVIVLTLCDLNISCFRNN